MHISKYLGIQLNTLELKWARSCAWGRGRSTTCYRRHRRSRGKTYMAGTTGVPVLGAQWSERVLGPASGQSSLLQWGQVGDVRVQCRMVQVQIKERGGRAWVPPRPLATSISTTARPVRASGSNNKAPKEESPNDNDGDNSVCYHGLSINYFIFVIFIVFCKKTSKFMDASWYFLFDALCVLTRTSSSSANAILGRPIIILVFQF
jgi:hypothetical protein